MNFQVTVLGYLLYTLSAVFLAYLTDVTDSHFTQYTHSQNKTKRLRWCGPLIIHYNPLTRNYKRGLDYLFYVPDPEHAPEENEVLHILENGFESADHYKVTQVSACVFVQYIH